MDVCLDVGTASLGSFVALANQSMTLGVPVYPDIEQSMLLPTPDGLLSLSGYLQACLSYGSSLESMESDMTVTATHLALVLAYGGHTCWATAWTHWEAHHILMSHTCDRGGGVC